MEFGETLRVVVEIESRTRAEFDDTSLGAAHEVPANVSQATSLRQHEGRVVSQGEDSTPGGSIDSAGHPFSFEEGRSGRTSVGHSPILGRRTTAVRRRTTSVCSGGHPSRRDLRPGPKPEGVPDPFDVSFR